MKKAIINIVSVAFGILVIIDGVLNLLRGNDPEFGVFLILLSSIYFPPTTKLVKNWFGIKIHYLVKILLALLIIWITLAVGAINEGYWPEILEVTN